MGDKVVFIIEGEFGNFCCIIVFKVDVIEGGFVLSVVS